MSLRRGAERRTLQIRADLLARAREFFARRGVLEVETPALSRAATTDPALTSLTTRVTGLGSLYLQTSPEFAMKRLLSDGSGDIYQVCRVYRDGEIGRWHQPEFTLLEWYRVGLGVDELIDEIEQLLCELVAPYRTLEPIARRSYAELFEDTLGIDPHGDCAGLAERLRARGIDAAPTLDRDALLDLALATVVGPSFRRHALTFVTDYPVSQAALARIRATRPPVAERFEAFIGPLEIANGFGELGDPAEQRLRFERENAERRRRGLAPVVLDDDFLEALGRLPDCAGVALGFDRLVAVAAGADSIASTLTFAHTLPR